jgi:hypothetical protein
MSLDAAKRILLGYIGLVPKSEDSEGYQSAITAIRILEAAPKVDKKACLNHLSHITAVLGYPEVQAYAGSHTTLEQTLEGQIYTILEALPEEPEEKK